MTSGVGGENDDRSDAITSGAKSAPSSNARSARKRRKDRNDPSLFRDESGKMSEDQKYYLRQLNENPYPYKNRREEFKQAAKYASTDFDEPWKNRNFQTPYPGCGVSHLLYEKIIALYDKVEAGVQGDDLIPEIRDAITSRKGTARTSDGGAYAKKIKTASGMRIGGIYASVYDVSWGEASYDALTSHPVPKANSWPLVLDQRQAALYRFPPKVMDYCGPRVNTSASLDYYDVLSTLDRCIRFESIPVSKEKLEDFKAAVASDQSAYKVSGSFLLMTEFHNTRSKLGSMRFGQFLHHASYNNIKSPFYDDAVAETARMLRNDDIAAGKEIFSDEEYNIRAQEAYTYRHKANLVSDYRDFWPTFPYVCKSNPNYYFENLRTFLEDVHPIFGLYGNDCLLQGWNAFPQAIVGVRKPIGWYGHSIAQLAKAHMPDDDNIDGYTALRPSALKTIRLLPYTFPVWWWTIHQADKNVALCLGRMTGNVIALDIDVTDRIAVGRVIKAVEETLGISPFIRVGNYPKVMLLYRLPEGVTMTSKSIPLGNNLGMVEILSEGKVITAFGVHHKLHTTFQWIGGKNPAENSPKEAPVVTLSDLEDFLVKVSVDVAPIEAKYLPKVIAADGSKSVRGNPLTGVKSGAGGTSAIYEYDSLGKISNGRSVYVRDVAFLSLVRHKKDIEKYGARDCLDQCVADAVATIKENMVLDGGRWQEETIEGIVRRDIANMLDKIGNDPEFTERLNKEISVTHNGPLRSGKQADHQFAPRDGRRGLMFFGSFRTNETPDVSFREIKGRDAEVSTNVRVREPSYNVLSPNGRNVAYPDDTVRFNIAQDLSGHLERFLRCVYNGQDVPKRAEDQRRPLVTAAMIEEIATRDPREAEAPKPPEQTTEQKIAEALELRESVMVVDVPTGSGKTSRLIEAIVNDPRTIEPQEWYDEKDVERANPKMVNRPFVIAMPNYNNIEEAVARARILCMKKGMDDETLIKELLAQGCVKDEADARARLPEIRQTIENSTRDESLPAPKIQVYRGREKSNCAFTYELKQLAAAHQPADRLCAATVKDSKTGEDKEVFCEHYATCSYIKQKEDVKEANIIFLVHSFLGNNALPESIKQVRALIIDEQIHHQFMHTQFMEREQFDISAEIFNLWDMEYADTPEKIKKYKAHNDYMYAQREAIPMRDWLIDLVIACAKERKDPAFEIMKSTQRFDIEQWRVKERPDYDGVSSDLYEGHEDEDDLPEDQAPAEPLVIAPIGPVLSEEDQQKAIMSARQRARKAYVNFVAEAERDSEGNVIEKDGFLSPRQVLDNAIGFLCSLFKQDVRIEPGMTNTRIRAKLSQPGLINAEAEREMWRAIQERIAAIELDNARIFREKAHEDSLYAFLEDFGVERGSEEYENLLDENPIVARRVARIEQEMCLYRHNNQAKIANPSLIDPRFQFVLRRKEMERGVEMVPMLRFSWRTQPGWEKTPLMLMDASADRRIIKKIFSPRPVEVFTTREDKGRILNMEVVVVTDHLYSNNSLIGSKDASITQKVKAARNLSNVRDAISMVCANHAGSRVVFGSPKNVRQAILTGWEDKPSQLDSCHFGAMRGIDVYKKHMALLCIGRMEPPIEDIDAMAACFSYDDINYEQPFNINGNGCEDAEGERPLYQKKYPRMIHMRNRPVDHGDKKEVATFMTAMVEGEWGRIVQNQCREEEINQAVGRLRPVYRTPSERPTCYILSSAIPEHLVVDDVVSIYDLIGTDGRTNIRIGSKMEEGMSLPNVVVKERLAKWHLMTLLRIAARFDSMLCPREIFEQASHLLPSELRSEEAIVNTLRTFHFKADEMNDRGGIKSRNAYLATSDGWYGVEVRNPATGALQEVWTPIAKYKDVEEATACIEERYSSFVERVLHVPQKIVCYSREEDAVDAAALSGGEDENLAALVSIRSAVEKMMSEEIVEIIGGKEVKTKAIAPTCFDGQTLLSDIPLYNMTSPLLDAIMQVSPTLSPEAMAKVAEMQSRVRYVKMTYEQIMAFMAIQQVWGDTAEDIAARLKSVTLSSDGIPKAYLSIRSKMAQLESEAQSGVLTQDQVKREEKRFGEITQAHAASSEVASAADATPTANRPRRRATGQSANVDYDDFALEGVNE